MGTQLPLPKKGTAPSFRPISVVEQMAECIEMPLGREVGLGPSDIVLDGDPAPPPKKAAEPPPPVSSPFIVAKRLDGSRWHLAWRKASVQATLR